ncbi:MurR/RpiR family transcriptional regulator [Enterococcus montenegrensis]|uniref:MurR/RpiR family transcriptional regulator n=1 Tax=Enterococcus TaxID=1350 RepID=UPI001E28D0CD|nr:MULTISPECIES: MurR/RpiR family transcriptional regulator [Enterococcus]MCD1025399.1 MurR/RpiR family transcriptional regulator [Enterococcus sp. SMC-9]WHA09452.1 MurR/RpiR family transcriptional regulator [Enterococcus montenegrensis]
MDILQTIQQKYNELSDKEKAIANYVLQNDSSLQNMNITSLSQVTGASTSTITRFCRKMGAVSYVDMKMKINSISNQFEVKQDDYFDQIYYYYNKIIDRTNKSLDKKLIYEAIKKIKTAKRIYIYGLGSSGFTAEELNLRFLKMGMTARCLTNTHLMLIGSRSLTEDDLVIAISSSGATDEIVETLDICKEQGAGIISITSFADSYISEISDISLVVFSSNFADEKKFVNTQFAIIYLLDIITTILMSGEEEYERNYEEVDEMMTKRNRHDKHNITSKSHSIK